MPTPPVPQHSPSPVELDDLELIVGGALGPGAAFNEPGSVVTLTLPDEVAAEARSVGAVELVDPEGLPLARVAWPAGTVDPLTHAEFGPFRDLALSVAAYRERHAGRTVVPVTEPLTADQLTELDGPVTLLALTGTGTSWLSPVGLVRATRAAADLLTDAVVVTVPVPSHGDPEADHALGLRVVEAYAAGDPVHALTSPTVAPVVEEVAGQPHSAGVEEVAQQPSRSHPREGTRPASPVVEEVAQQPSRNHPSEGTRPASPVVEEVAQQPSRNHPSEGTYPPEIQAVVDHDRPPADQQGLVVFFTGLSGSGKSTLARALVDRVLEQGERTVTSLDGDVVRRNLSAGLTFSKEDRETNIRRIGWVAAEIARHGGVAVVSPIAPFDETRKQVRAMVEDAGGALFLVHVATPLAECERRDRKGLYAKARAGQIPEFTGISSPYEEPQDADVRVDTTGRTIDDALENVLVGLRDEGYVDLTVAEEHGAPPVAEVRGALATSLEVSAAPETKPLEVLFVCTANICRSPSAELLARHASPDETAVRFSSAGTHGYVDSPIDDVLRAALPAGIDASDFRSRRLTPDLLAGADLVLTAEAAHRTFILDDHPELFRKVFTLGQFAHAVERAPDDLDRDALLAHVAAARGAADPSLDVPDPYRRGPEAASGCVARLEELLRTVLPALSR